MVRSPILSCAWFAETAKRNVISQFADAFFERFDPDAPRKRTSPAAQPRNAALLTVPVSAATFFFQPSVTTVPESVCVSSKLKTGIVTSTPATFPSPSTPIAPPKSGASFGAFAVVPSDWFMCIVPPPVSNDVEYESSPSPPSSPPDEPVDAYSALTLHVVELTRSSTSTDSNDMPVTVFDFAFVRAAARAASSSAASKTR